MKVFGAPRFKSVGFKLFIIIFCSILLLCAALGLTSYSIAKQIITSQVASASSQSVVQVADKLDFLLSGYEATSRQFAVDSVLKADIAIIHDPASGTVKKVAAEDRIRRKLDALMGSDDRLLGVRLVSKNMVDAESYRSVGLSGIRSDDQISAKIRQIEEAKGNPVWFPVEAKGFFANSSESGFAMGRLLRNLQHPDMEYYMLIEIKGSALDGILSDLQIGRTGQIRLLGEDDSIVYAKDETLLGQTSTIHIPEQKNEQDKHSFTSENEQGQSLLVLYQPLATAPWTMLGYAPVSDFTESASKLLYITLAVLLAAALIAGLIGLLLVRSIGRPLGEMAKLMEEGEQGNLRVRASFKGNDEIGRLGHSFNHMMEQIALLVGKSGSSANEVLATSQRLVEASQEISLHAQEVAAATEEIAGGTVSMAEEMNRSNGSVQAMGVQMQKVSGINEEMHASAGRVIEVSDQGTGLMDGLVNKSENAMDKMDRIQKNTDKLRESMERISSILTPMIAINKQTNILALNASIEAVRAGSAGRGFVVIADEIRQLAHHSGRSIQSVSEIISEVAVDMEGVVGLVNESAPIFQEQIASVHDSAKAFAGVKREMGIFQEQLRESSRLFEELLKFQQELGLSVTHVASVAQQTGAATEEVASMSAQQLTVSKELAKLSGMLEELAGDLKESLVFFRGTETEEPDPAERESAQADDSRR